MNNLITPDLVTPESLIPVPSTTENPKASRKMQPSGNGKNTPQDSESDHKTRNQKHETILVL